MLAHFCDLIFQIDYDYIIEETYRGLLIAPKPPRPRYPRPAPRNPPPRPRGGLLLVVMPGLFVRFGSTLICLPLKNNF